MTRTLIIAAFLLGLLSSGSAYSQPHVRTLNLLERDQNTIREAFKVTLTEPWSPNFRFPQQGEDPYTYCEIVNARNRMGDYTELFPFWVMTLRNGIGFTSMSKDSRNAKNIIAVCQKIEYLNKK